jgi:hypothetical protein
MDYWPVLGLLCILALWGAIALVPWYVALIARRGRGAFVGLPIAVAAGIAGGALTPALGGKDAFGFGISLLAALIAGAAASLAPRMSLHLPFMRER